MIKEKRIIQKISNVNRARFRELGYDIDNKTQEILINVTDLNRNSETRITAICEICGDERSLMYYKYMDNYERYNYYGCKSCSRKKASKTNLELYGETDYLKTETGKNHVADAFMKKYGYTNSMLDPEIQEKKNNTMIERYGSKCALMNDDVWQKSVDTNMRLYGAETYNKSIYFKKDVHNKWIKFYKNILPQKYNIHDFSVSNDKTLSIKCDRCNKYYETTYKLLYQRTHLYNVETCTICNPLNNSISWAEQELYDYVNDITDFEQTNKTILCGKHIDMYSDKYKFGIEYNGIFWHSDKYVDDFYHYNKYINAKLNNIKLFNVFENEWEHNKDVIKRLLKTNLTGEYTDFMNYEIIQSTKKKALTIFNGIVSKYNYQLKIDDIIVGEISFNDDTITYFNFNVNYNCTDVFNIFVDELKLENYYYIHDNNNVFLNIDYNFVKYVEPDYMYYDLSDKNMKLMNKHKINQKYNNNYTKILENNYVRIYDSGYSLYKLTKTNEVEEFLINDNIQYTKIDNVLSIVSFDNKIIELTYIDSLKYTTNDIDKKYFYNKSVDAEKDGRFIFWIKDFEWNDENQRNIIKSYIRHLVGKTKTKIYARDCEVKIIDNKTARKFEEKNCFYGKRGSSFNLGLVLNKDKYNLKKGDLVMLYTFGYNYFTGDDSILEIIRVGTLIDSMVVGGSSKLFKHFVNNRKKYSYDNINKIKFYSDYDHNMGNSMNILGFDFKGYSDGGYMNYWINENKIKHRQPTKNELIKKEIKRGNVLVIPNAGVKIFEYSFI